jgi:hypothetical protein
VLSYLPVRSVNKVHLVCHNLHRIAEFWVNPVLRFSRKPTFKSLERLVHSSRVFHELKFKGFDLFSLPVYLLVTPCGEEIVKQFIEKFFGSMAPYIKKLSINHVTLSTEFLTNLINALPNLESIKLDHVEVPNGQIVNA